MTDDQHIQELLTAPLVIPRTRREHFWDVVQRVCALISVLALATAAVGIVLVFQLAICTNTNLGQRSAPSQKDAAAHIAFAALLRVGVTKSPPSADERRALATAFGVKLAAGAFPTQAQFLDGVNAYERVLAADQKMRDTHPLGKC